MATAATSSEEGGATPGARDDRAAASLPAADFRAALELALSEADGDERLGPRLRASEMRVRLEFPDCGVVLNLWVEGQRALRWAFSDVSWRPELELTMDSGLANRFLQGRESLAVAIARGQARLRGSRRAALRWLPAARLLGETYGRVVGERFPSLAAAGR